MCAVTWALLAALVLAHSAAQEPALRCRHARCRYLGGDYYNSYEVDDKELTIRHNMSRLIIMCDENDVLESPALPSAELALRVTYVELVSCPPPATGSLVDTLATLNVTMEAPGGNLTLLNLPATPPLTAKHFVGLECLVQLKVFWVGNTHLSPERGFLTPLQSLHTLKIWYMVMPVDELVVPPSLRELHISHIKGIDRLPLTPTLELLSITGWNKPLLESLSPCNSLLELQLEQIAVTALPDDWLVRCSRLEVLMITRAHHLTTLPPKLLLSLSALKHLAFRDGALVTLPEGLLDHSPNLSTLKLDVNHLQSLPSGTFSVARQVRELDLSSNKLNIDVTDALAPLEELAELNLRNNPRLANICGSDGYSPIRNMTKLRKLLLDDTGVNQICRDWRHDMFLLEKLELGFTGVSKLSFEELQFTRTVKAEVVVWDSSVTTVQMTREDYNAASKLSGNTSIRFVYRHHFQLKLECDCRMYWTRRTLDLTLPALEHFGGLPCTDGRLLRDMPPEDMVCARPEECAAAELPAACECSMWAADDPDQDPRLVRVRCEHAELFSVPHPRDNSTERRYELLLAHNRIAVLQTDDLPRNIMGLDLRNNLLSVVDEDTARRLGDINGNLFLAGNPLECSCRAVPLLRALHARNATQTDLINATCSDASPLDDTPIVECPPAKAPEALLNTWLVGGLVTLLVLALAAVASLASHERRFFVQAVLHRWGFLWRAAEPEEDEGRCYDAFVTFSHKDETVMLELLARLEPTYRVCLHYRDWTPGRFITEQVVESVRESRRTVALVSRHFLASSWARAEFREAHAAAMLDARPRLIVVLLEEPDELEMDEQLRRYVATHTYLRWGEPWFWDKLAVALPRPRAPRAPLPTPTAPLAEHNLELSPAPT